MTSTSAVSSSEKALVFLLGTSSADVASRIGDAAVAAGVGLRLIETAPQLLRAAQQSSPDAVLVDVAIGGGLSATELLFALRDEPTTSALPVLLVGAPDLSDARGLLAAAAEFPGVDICPTTDKSHLELRIKWVARLCRSYAKIEELQSRVEELMTTDLTTHLFNHQEILRLLGSQCKIADRYGRDLSVIYADIDYLGLLNEQHGYETGDDILRAFASSAKKSCRAADVLGRLGGGDFLLILPETSLEGAKILAERIRTSFESSPDTRQVSASLPVTASLACAQKLRSEDEHRLLARVGRALRQAKDTGRNRVAVAGSPVSLESP
jgi:diguanylate cyclase (GGDEF)-like protein